MPWSLYSNHAFPTLAALLTLAGALALSRPVSAQISAGDDVSRYDALYGKPVDVAVDDLVQESVSYTNRAVRTHGRLELSFETTQRELPAARPPATRSASSPCARWRRNGSRSR